MSGCLFIIAAPSGAGESEGSHYHFVTRGEFEAMVARGEFFEHAVVHGDLKGTARHTVERPLAEGRDVLLEIDYQGARQVRALVPDCVSVFILPPSRVELERRLRGRGQDAEEVIQRRLADSRTEIAHLEDFDYLLVNDVFERTLDDLLAIVRAERLKRFRQARSQKALIDALLA
jgi:guanylate kinase